MKQLSILIPGIRPGNWEKLYKSIEASFHGSWEIVFVGPYGLPDFFKDKTNVQYIEDWGSPIRCRQIALIKSVGEWICFAADDVEFCPDALDLAFTILLANGMNKNIAIMGKYVEGGMQNKAMLDDSYYKLATHDAIRESVKWFNDYWLFNTGLVHRDTLISVGGWDCQFEACAMACVDMGIRLQNANIQFIKQDAPFFLSTWDPGQSADHGPIHDVQTQHDMPLFYEIYSKPECVNRIVVPIDDWKQCPERWERRFGKA